MRVIVDEARDDGPALEIDALRRVVRVLGDISVRSRGDDTLALDRERLHDGEPVVHRDDLSVRQYEVRIGAAGRRQRGNEQRCEEKHAREIHGLPA
jgi:hypothetical protein